MSKHNFTADDDALLNELGIEVEAKSEPELSPLEERIIDGFQDILRFYEEKGRLPSLDNGEDLFEKRYAIRLNQIRKNTEYQKLLSEYDRFDILDQYEPDATEQLDSLSD